MTPIRIRGIGVVGGFGCGRGALAKALLQGRSTPSTLAISHGGSTVELRALRADLGPLEEFVPKRMLRRVDTFGRFAILGAHLALRDAEFLGSDHQGTALVLASSYGASASTFALIDSVIQDGDPFSSPIHFANSLHSSAAANLSIHLGITGTNLTVSQGYLSVPSALLSAVQMLNTGKAKRILFGAVEELSELVAYLWLRSFEELPSDSPKALPGEGAVFFLLERGEGPGHAIIEHLEMGLRIEDHPKPETSEPLLLGTFPGLAGDTFNPSVLRCPWTSFVDCYGVSPATPAFDLASVCELLKGLPVTGDLSASERISCFSPVPGEGYGWITLRRCVS